MAKKSGTKSAPSSPARTAPLDPEGLAQLKEEGNQLFARKDYEKALECYDKALKLVPADSADAALLHSNKAACHMMYKKFKEAVNECSAALDTQPNFFKALVRRAKAYEQMGLFKQALSDFQRANKLDTATTETREAEKRLRDIVTGKKSGAANGAVAKKAVPSKAAPTGRQVAFPAKLSLDDDTRFLHLVPGVTYLELMEHVKQLYPSAGPFVLKFLDKEGDLVTIASRNDLQRAMAEAVEAAQKGSGPRLPVTQNNLPPIRLQVVRVASEEEVPKIPEEEMAYVQHMLAQLQKAQAAQQAQAAAAAQQAPASAQDEQQQQQIQIDEWILTFVDLLKEHCGLDPDRPIECNEIGSEKLNQAFTEMMENDPKADELLGQAYEKFEDQVCLGMYNQATVHQARAELLISKAAKAGTPATEIADAVEANLKKAEAKFEEALAYKASFLDGYLGKSHLAQLRGKLAANYLVEVAKPREDIKDAKERQAAEEAANRAHIKAAFARVTPDMAKKAEPFFEASYGLVKQAMEHMSEEDKAKEIKPMKPTAEQTPNDPDSEVVLKSTLLITLGNAHYEHSIVRAAGGLEWRPLVEAAAAKFREAGAHEVDIRNALKGHPLAEELSDLIGPEPEPEPAAEEAAAAAAPAAAAAEEEAPKGLPALGPKPKKKEAASA